MHPHKVTFTHALQLSLSWSQKNDSELVSCQNGKCLISFTALRIYLDIMFKV